MYDLFPLGVQQCRIISIRWCQFFLILWFWFCVAYSWDCTFVGALVFLVSIWKITLSLFVFDSLGRVTQEGRKNWATANSNDSTVKEPNLIWRFIDWQGYTYMYKHEKHRFIDLYVWDDDLFKCVHLHFFYSAKLTHEAVWYLSFHFCFDLFLLFLFLESFEDMNLLWFWFCLKYETRNKNIYNFF